MFINNHLLNIKSHYSKLYSPVIASKKITMPYFQYVTHGYFATAVPDQPIKASMTYWLVSNAFALFECFLNHKRGRYAINQ